MKNVKQIIAGFVMMTSVIAEATPVTLCSFAKGQKNESGVIEFKNPEVIQVLKPGKEILVLKQEAGKQFMAYRTDSDLIQLTVLDLTTGKYNASVSDGKSVLLIDSELNVALTCQTRNAQ